MRISIAIFSYDGGLYFGVTGDYDSSDDIDVLTAGIEKSMAQLLAASAPPKKRPAAAGARARKKRSAGTAAKHETGAAASTSQA